MELVGRIVKNAIVRTIKKNNHKVTSFTLALNDYYKPKDAEKGIKVTTYVECSYWINPGIATYLTQGTLIEVYGRLYATAYNDKDENPRASINCHVNTIKFHSRTSMQNEGSNEANKEKIKEDLPF